MVNTININILIEIKHELNELVIDDISPSVFDGILEIYNRTKEMSNDTTIMKTFQKCMEKICLWDESKIKNVITILENRLNSTERFLKLKNIVKTLLRLNTQIMNYQSINLDTELENTDKITFEDFIRKVYIESARKIWSQPYLFYEKNLSSIEVKRNHLLVVSLIKESILSSIRKLIISKSTIDFILSNNYTVENPPFVQPMDNKFNVNQTGGDVNDKDEILNIINKNLKVSESDKSTIELNKNAFDSYTPKHSNVSEGKSSSTLKKIVNESFDKNKESAHGDSNHNSSRHSSRHSSHHNSDNISSRHSNRHSSKDSRHSTRYNTATNNISIDTSVKNKLIKDLMTDTVSYNPEDGNDKYQDIFSNSEVPDNTNRKMSKTLNKDKEHFYNSYLKK